MAQFPNLLNDRWIDDAALFRFDEIRKALCRTFVNPAFRPPLSVCIDGSWGSGKTSLMHTMCKALGDGAAGRAVDFVEGDEQAAARCCRPVFFNAWQYGEKGNALLAALLEEFRAGLLEPGVMDAMKRRIEAQLQGAPGEARERLVRRAVHAAAWLAKLGGGLAASAGRGIMERQLGKEFTDRVAGVLAPLKGAVEGALKDVSVDELFSDEISAAAWEEELSFYSTFEKTLGQFLALMLDEDDRLVVFIDDLDRCLDSEVVEVLKTAKLFFDTDRCVFVMGLDYELVRGVVRRKLGDAEGQRAGKEDPLEKLFQVRIRLMPKEPGDLGVFVGQEVKRLGLGVSADEQALVLEALRQRVVPVLRSEQRCQPRFIKRLLNSLSLQLELRRHTPGDSALPAGRARDMLTWCVLTNLSPYDRFASWIAGEGELKAARFRLARFREMAGELAGGRTPDAGAEEEAGSGAGKAGEAGGIAERYPGLAWLAEDARRREALESLLTDFDAGGLEDCLLYSATVGPQATATRPDAREPRRAEGVSPEELDLGHDFVVEGVEATHDRMVVRLTGGVRLECVRIAPGTFGMGSPERVGRGNEHPEHQVTISREYWMGLTPVTQAQYKVVMGRNPSRFQDRDDWRERPAERISWYAAVEFCHRLGAKAGMHVRLPTEAEWEYAARGKEGRTYPWGNRKPTPELANFDDNVGQTTPVGRYPGGATPEGLLDMAGNVCEWCADWYAEDYYGRGPAEDPQGPDDSDTRVLRGGSWDRYPRYCRSACRLRRPPGLRDSVGLRVVLLPRP